MVTLTKQDLHNVIESARIRLMDRVATRQDMQGLRDTVRTLTATLQQSHQLLRQEEYQRVQLVRRAVAMESRMIQMEHELQNMHRLMSQMANHQPTQKVTERVIMAQRGGYVYSPNPA